MSVYAEAVCMTCEDGMIFPLEIAFATSPDHIYIFQIAPPPEHYAQTMRDIANTRSRLRNRDRFYNSTIQRYSPIFPIAQYKLHPDIWLTELYQHIAHIFLGDIQLKVRGDYQYYFFKHICGFSVSKIWLLTGGDVMGCLHRHSSKIIKYPCPGIEVRTMAYHKNPLLDNPPIDPR